MDFKLFISLKCHGLLLNVFLYWRTLKSGNLFVKMEALQRCPLKVGRGPLETISVCGGRIQSTSSHRKLVHHSTPASCSEGWDCPYPNVHNFSLSCSARGESPTGFQGILWALMLWTGVCAASGWVLFCVTEFLVVSFRSSWLSQCFLSCAKSLWNSVLMDAEGDNTLAHQVHLLLQVGPRLPITDYIQPKQSVESHIFPSVVSLRITVSVKQ